jgi:hypothetical protein
MKEILVDKKTFCRVLGQLRRADIRKQDWALERMIESLEQCASPFRFYPYHDAVGMEDVLKRFSLLKELRIRGYVELGGLPAWRINKLRKPSHCLRNPLSRDRRHGALLYNELVSVQVARDDPGYGFYLAQIGFARLFLRGADADKQDCGSAHGLLDGMAQGQSTARQAAGEQIVQARLIEGDLA